MTLIEEVPVPDLPPTDRVSHRQVLLGWLAVLSAVAAVIHFAAAGAHFQEYWLFGAFMLGAAFVQALWAFAAVRGHGRWVPLVGVVINAGIVGVYVVTRTVGDVVGPSPHEVEPIGFGDGLCTSLEVLLVLGCVALAVRPFGGQTRDRVLRSSTSALGVAAAVLLSFALLDGGSEMTMSADEPAAAAGMHMDTTGAAVDLATTSPAGSITMPNPSMQMGDGMKMSSPACTTTPTAAQQRAAVRLVDTSWAKAKRFRKLSVAKAAGYVPVTPTGLPVVHYINIGYYRDTIFGGPVLNTARPQSLVYANTAHGAVLVASMYMMSPLAPTRPPRPGGCLTQWHVHTNLCLSGAGVVGLTDLGGCPAGSVNRVTPPMLHVWYVPIAGGPTAVDAPDRQIVRAAASVRSPANPRA